MVSPITYAFIAAHVIFAFLGYTAYRKSKLKLLFVTSFLHLLAIALLLLWREVLISMLSLPLILVSLIGLILEERI